MGLFKLFKKNGEENNEPNPEDQMLTLNERQKPALKSNSNPPTDTAAPRQPAAASPEVILTPDPQVNQGQKTVYNFAEEPGPEPQEYSRDNLSTKSLEKNIQSMPNVKKLVIPSNNDAMEKKVEATDTVFAERVKLKQVDLSGGEKQNETPLAPETNYIPGEFIDLPVSLLTEHIDPQYLSPNANTLFDSSEKIRFTKDEVLSIMAQGAFAVVGSALFARFPAGAVSEKGKTTADVLEFPLDKILTLVPPEWFALQGQDNSLTESLENMSNPFQDLETPKLPEEEPQETQEESTPAESSSSSLFENDEELSVEISDDDNEKTSIDTLATMDQTAPPVIEKEEVHAAASAEEKTTEIPQPDPLETMVQEKPPEIPQQAHAEQEVPVTDESTLVIPVSTVRPALSQEIFSNLSDAAYLQIPRDRVLSSLAEGVFRLSAKEVDTYAGTSAVDAANANQPVEIDLSLIIGLIPPEWFAIQGQDNSQNEILTNMRDVFDDSTFEEAAKDLEENEEEETVVVEEEEDNEEQAVQIEEEETIVVEEEEEESLITGGIFSKMNSLFEDEDEEEEETVVVEEEEQATAKPLIDDEDEIAPPVIREEPEIAPPVVKDQPVITPPVVKDEPAITPPVVKDEPAITPPVVKDQPAITPPVVKDQPVITPPVVKDQPVITPPVVKDEPAITPPVAKEEPAITPPVVEEEPEVAPLDSLQTITINRSDEKIFDEERIAREQAKVLENQVGQISEQISEAENKTQAPIEDHKDSADLDDEENKKAKGAGQITYRPIADEAPELTDKSELRPSTAPNGIDVNRSNLKDLCRLHSAGEKLAQTLIEYREQNGDFKSINELINVPGVGTSVYRSLTGLRPSADLVGAERRINKLVGLSTEKDFPLGKVIKEAQTQFNFKSLILSDKDGFEICSSGDKSLLESNSELLAATTPQLFKKTKHFLKQSNLPHPEIFTFYLEDTPVTFGIADEVFMVMVHSSKWPEPKHMKQCRELINELAWFCSYRAIV